MTTTDTKKKVLLVDDSSFIRWGLSEDLKNYGYEPITAESGPEALDKLFSIQDIRLILLDVQMKGWSGFETLAHIRDPKHEPRLIKAHNRLVPVIFVTARDTEQDRRRGFDLGAAEFVLKKDVRPHLKTLTDRYLRPTRELSGLGVLVVDDNKLVRHMVRMCLKPLGVRIFEAAGGDEALENLQRHRQAISLVITDHQMPGMGGIQLCSAIKSGTETEQLPVIFLSATNDKNEILEMFRVGGTDYLHKPFFREELTARLEIHLRRLLLDRHLYDHIRELDALNAFKQQFQTICSHDLRSPVAALANAAGNLPHQTDLFLSLEEQSRRIEGCAHHLLTLVDDLLDLDRNLFESTKHLPITVFDAAPLLHGCASSCAHIASLKNIVIEPECPDALHTLGNEQALRRAIHQLLDNAIKFSPPESVIRLHANDTHAGRVRISVTDQGIGIPQELLGDLYDDPSPARRPGTLGEEGEGRGMATIQTMIQAQGGALRLETRLDTGTTFTIDLPAASPPGTETPRETAQTDTAGEATGAAGEEQDDQEDEGLFDIDLTAPILTDLHVLAVDDDPVVRRILQNQLEQLHCDFAVLGSGREALEYYLEHLEENPLDLMLVDVEMDDLDGHDLTRALRDLEEQRLVENNLEQHLEIVALTAHEDQETHMTLINEGMDQVVTKPINQKQMKALLERVATKTGKGEC